MTACICVDVSSYQKGFSFAEFKASGGLGVILKATEGTTHKDSCYEEFRSQALDVGLATASYHFFSASDPAAQAEFYLDVADPRQGERVVCDWENASGADAVVVFLQAIQRAHPDLQLTVYSGHTAKQALGSTRNAWLAENTSLWLAEYSGGSAPKSWPSATWPQWALWQYTGTGQAPGFDGALDLNQFNGSNDKFLRWMGPPPPVEPPVVTISSDKPVVTISSDKPVRIMLGPNVSLAGTLS